MMGKEPEEGSAEDGDVYDIVKVAGKKQRLLKTETRGRCKILTDDRTMMSDCYGEKRKKEIKIKIFPVYWSSAKQSILTLFIRLLSSEVNDKTGR